MTFLARTLSVATLAAALLLPSSVAQAAGDVGPDIARQPWSFSGIRGHFDDNQLRRGFQVYKEVCSSCHGLKRINFRNLVERGGPEFNEEGAKNLASTYQVQDGPNDQGKMFKRPARLTDAMPGPFSNDAEARSANNGALPPDLSLITKARGIEVSRPFYAVPFAIVRDVLSGYQEAGSDYVHALLTGYLEKVPVGTKNSDGTPFVLGAGMNYNPYFPGAQIAMANPLSNGIVKYAKRADGRPEAPETVDQYARDVTAFLSWAGDPKLEERKRMGPLVMLYLLLTSLLLYLAKRRMWSKVGH